MNNKMNRMKTTLTGLLLLFALLPLTARERTDTVYTFRFVPTDDMFYVPFRGNEAELARLERHVARYRQRVLDGEIPLHVEGHADRHATAMTRSNRVKSELITRQGLREDCFLTRNVADGQHYVTVTMRMPCPTPAPEGDGSGSPSPDGKDDTANTIYKNDDASANADSSLYNKAERPVEALPQEGAMASAKDYALALRVNLLRWATLTPDIGLEWRVSRSWGILVRGSWTSWSWNDKDRRYALWEVSPEVRYYMGKKKRGYIGAMYKAGSFNYKLSTVGKQGDLMGGGITGGYQLRLNNALSMDFNVGIGCLHADYDKYTVIDGVRVRGGKESKNWWGPVNAGVTLVWKIY